jgi:hypothetical protein
MRFWRHVSNSHRNINLKSLNPCVKEEEEEELRVQVGPSVNQVSFRARPHRNAHNILGVNTKLLALESMRTSKNDFFELQNTTVPFRHMKKKLVFQLE